MPPGPSGYCGDVMWKMNTAHFTGSISAQTRVNSKITVVDLLAGLKALQNFSMSTNSVYLPFKQIAIPILLIVPTFYHQTLAALNLQPAKIPS